LRLVGTQPWLRTLVECEVVDSTLFESTSFNRPSAGPQVSYALAFNNGAQTWPLMYNSWTCCHMGASTGVVKIRGGIACSGSSVEHSTLLGWNPHLTSSSAQSTTSQASLGSVTFNVCTFWCTCRSGRKQSQKQHLDTGSNACSCRSGTERRVHLQSATELIPTKAVALHTPVGEAACKTTAMLPCNIPGRGVRRRGGICQG
jgi:hypothetical protein